MSDTQATVFLNIVEVSISRHFNLSNQLYQLSHKIWISTVFTNAQACY